MTSRAQTAEMHEHQRLLWALCYRMTGSAADSDDLVQETFARALERPPADLERPLRPWLVRVAMNLARDALRRRRRRAYVGPWLPAPVEAPGTPPAGEEPEPPSLDGAPGAPSPAARYDLLESASYAFLLALEALTPRQRAVLILRDVLDYSVAETAEALALSEANVKVSHHRARTAMASYDQRRAPAAAGSARSRDALARFLTAIASGDAKAVEALLAADVRAVSDGGGVYAAARKPVVGPTAVARLYLGFARHGAPPRVELRAFAGLSWLLASGADLKPRWAPRYALAVSVDADGRIDRIYSVLAPRKLTGIQFSE